MRWLLFCLLGVFCFHMQTSTAFTNQGCVRGGSLERASSTTTLALRYARTSLHMSLPAFLHNSMSLSGIDVSGLKVVPVPEDMLDLVQSNTAASAASSIGSGDLASDIQNLLILLGGIAYFVYEKRPRGNARDDLLDIRTSDIPGLANMSPEPGLGVFATKFVAKETLLGSFPGYLLPMDECLKSKSSEQAKGLAKKYLWSLTDIDVLDPTNSNGALDLEISYVGGLIKVNTMMARINEPPLGKDCNVYTKIEGSEVLVYAERNLLAGEELYMDYGSYYNREDYDLTESQEREKKAAEIQRRLEEEEFMTLQSVVNEGTDGGPQPDQDTTLQGGFISKLKDKDSQYKRTGIISPTEGAALFGELGAKGLTGSAEDRDLLQSILGKDDNEKIATTGTPSPSGGAAGTDPESVRAEEKRMMEQLLGGASIRSPDNSILTNEGADEGVPGARGANGGGDKFPAADGGDDDLLASLKQQMGSANLENMENIPDIASSFSSPPPSSPSPSATSTTNTDPPAPPAPAGGAGAGPRLTTEEAIDLQNRIDNMSDEQLEKVFSKMRTALGDQAKEEQASEMADVIQEAKRLQQEAKGVSGNKTMPRAQALDPAIREKYDDELNAIEDELEKLYNDPLSVWQDLMKGKDIGGNEKE